MFLYGKLVLGLQIAVGEKWHILEDLISCLQHNSVLVRLFDLTVEENKSN